MNIDESYIEKTEKYIEQHKNDMDEQVYFFIKELCLTERKMIELVQEQKRF
jgi:hypothetical protein